MFDDPFKTLKNQALKIWDTKDYANRLAFNNTQWFLALVWCFMFITILDLVVLVTIGDLFVLWDFYSSGWYIDFLEDIFYETTFLRIGLIFFFASPKIVRFELLVWRNYNQREKRTFEWLETKIKQRFPNFKTSAQRARERLAKPKKEPSKTQKWFRSRPPAERALIRVAIWTAWAFTVGSFMFFFLSMDELIFDCEFDLRTLECEPIYFDPELAKELLEDLKQKLPPEKPTGRPPPTIYDIFINEPDLVTP